MTDTYSVVLVEDHPAWNELLAIKLKPIVKLNLRARVSSMQEALAFIADEPPDLLVVDVVLRDSCGLDLCQKCQQIAPDTQRAILSAYDEDVYLARAWENSVNGFLLKMEEMSAILKSLASAAQGEVLWDEYQRLRIQHWRQVAGDKWDSLTQREQEVVRALVNYCTDTEIAEALNISSYTVNNHLKRILQKLSLHNRREVSRWAVRYKVMAYSY